MNVNVPPRRLWNAVALVATLGLAAVVAVVAVTRSERGSGTATESPTPTPSPSPSPTGPGDLSGEGPYLIYSTSGGEIHAYDLEAGRAVTVGSVEATPVIDGSRQPGDGRLVAFPTEDGGVWTVTRKGLQQVGTITRAAAGSLIGRATSPDGRQMASLALEPAPALVVVDLDDGGVQVKRDGFRGEEPDEPLMPVGWSLGGTVVYAVPFCRCEEWTAGLFALDLDAETLAVVPGTRADQMDRFVMTNEGQSLLYGTEGPSFTLRRVSAGQRAADVLRQSREASLEPLALSHDGTHVLLRRTEARSGRIRFEVAEADTGDEVQSDLVDRIPTGATPLAFPSEEAVVVSVPTGSGPQVLLVRQDRTLNLASNEAAGSGPVFLGWLR